MNNQINPKELHCQLYCKASAEVNQSVADDLRKEDKSLQDLLGKDDNDTQEAPKDNTERSN